MWENSNQSGEFNIEEDGGYIIQIKNLGSKLLDVILHIPSKKM